MSEWTSRRRPVSGGLSPITPSGSQSDGLAQEKAAGLTQEPPELPARHRARDPEIPRGLTGQWLPCLSCKSDPWPLGELLRQ